MVWKLRGFFFLVIKYRIPSFLSVKKLGAFWVWTRGADHESQSFKSILCAYVFCFLLWFYYVVFLVLDGGDVWSAHNVVIPCTHPNFSLLYYRAHMGMFSVSYFDFIYVVFLVRISRWCYEVVLVSNFVATWFVLDFFFGGSYFVNFPFWFRFRSVRFRSVFGISLVL